MVFTLFLFILNVFSHSWLECPLYTGDKETYEPENCQGLPRPLAGNRNVGNTFGQDIGMDFRPQANGARCQGDHATGTPNMVTYQTGQTYTLAWPPKNHVAAACTNPFIPDAFLKLYMAPYDPNTPPDQATFREMQVPATFSDDPHVSGQIDYKGFQNCPKFCENTDKSLCTGDFAIPAGIAPGTYTFQWYWAFNGAADLYATCWEANVVAGDGTSVDATTTGAPDETIPPGCTDCCASGTLQAPGTESMVNYGVLENLENEYYNCPEGFEGEFKLLCVDTEARIVDGFCLESSLFASIVSGNGKNQDGTIAGLSLALAFITIAFILYVGFTNGWIDESTFGCGEGKSKSNSSQQMYSNNNYDPESAPPSSGTRVKANSVFTISKTELPILPTVPVEWHYVNGSASVGPVGEPQMMAFLRAQNPDVARSTLVWNGTTVADWTAVSDIPFLVKQLR